MPDGMTRTERRRRGREGKGNEEEKGRARGRGRRRGKEIGSTARQIVRAVHGGAGRAVEPYCRLK